MSHEVFLQSDEAFADVKVVPMTEYHAESMFSVIKREQDYLGNFNDLSDAKIESANELIEGADYRVGLRERYMILTTGILVGSLTVDMASKDSNIARLEFWVSRKNKDQGIGTAAVKLVADSVLAGPIIQEVDTVTHKNNRASQKVLENAGFILLGYDTGQINKLRYAKNSAPKA